ncbi:MAG: hypothetical protein Q9179_004525 [Wetmoreana sp. 5 TL-2023]
MAQPPDHDQSPPTEADSACDDNDRLYAKYEASKAIFKQQDEQADPEASHGDILRLISLNTQARRAFDSVARLNKDGGLNEVHAQHVHITGKGTLSRDSSDRAPKESDVTTDEAQSDDQGFSSKRIVYEGYFRVRFDLPAVSQNPVWVIGKGSEKKFGPTRNVDILLAAPRSEDARGLRAVHAYLGMHLKSGAWILRAGANMEVDDEILEATGVVVLYRPKTRFSVCDMQYLIQFIVQTPETEQKYLRERDRMFREQGIPQPHTDISGTPFPTDTVLDSIVFRYRLGSGGFGCVYEGFRPKSGDLRVAKRVTLKSQREVPTIEGEIRALEKFDGREEPPQARLFDFGKFCDTSEAVDTRLAAWPFLPPELEEGKQILYGQSLDIWMLGLALAKSWWPETAQMKPRVEADHDLILNYLWDEKRDGADLAHLVAGMMSWKPSKRPSAALALKHRGLQKVPEGETPVKTSDAKRLHDDNDG